VTETAPAPPVPAQTGPVRVSAGQGPGLVKRVEPRYPPLLQSGRIEGTVVLDAVIHKDGRVAEIKVLQSSHPMFAAAAEEAIKQWQYSQSDYDVILTVRVNFTLK